MKRIFCLFIALIAIASLFSCQVIDSGATQLDTVSNVVIDNEGLISWSPVSNATSYFVVINGQSYPTTNTFFQVANIKEDFDYYVVAQSTDKAYSQSLPSDTKRFVGTSAALKEELFQTIVNYLQVDFTDFSAEFEEDLNEASNHAYYYDITADTVNSFVGTISEAKSTEELVYSIASSLSVLSDKQITGITRFVVEFASVLITEYSKQINVLSNDFTSLYENLQQTKELLEKNDYQFADSLANIIISMLNVYKQGLLQVIPLVQHVTSCTSEEIPQKIYDLKNAAINVLVNNAPNAEDVIVVLETILSAAQINVDLITSAIGSSNPKLEEVITEISGMIKELNIEELAATLTQVGYSAFEAIFARIKAYSVEQLTKAFQCETLQQTILTIVLDLIGDINVDLPEITPDLIFSVIDLIDQLGLIDMGGATIQEATNLDPQVFNQLVVYATDLLNALIAGANDVADIEDIKQLIINASGLGINISKYNSYNQLTIDMNDVKYCDFIDEIGVGVEELTPGMILEHYEIGDAVDVYFCVAKYYTIIHIDETSVAYELYTVEHSFTNLEGAFELLKQFVSVYNNHSEEIGIAVANIVSLFLGVNNPELVQEVFNDLGVVLVAALDFVATNNPGELLSTIYLGINEKDIAPILPLILPFIGPNSQIIHDLADSVGSLLEGYGLMEMVGFESKQQFVEFVDGLLDF